MEINATRKDGKYVLALSGVPAGAVAEVRFQNTMNGVVFVSDVDVNNDGNAAVPAPTDFGQHCAVVLRILTADNHDREIPLTFVAGNNADQLRLVSADVAQRAAPAPAAPVATK